MARIGTLPLLAVAFALTAAPASAATLTYSQNYGPVSLAGPPSIGPVNFSQFDPTLGVLTGVTFDLSVVTTARYQFENLDSAAPASASLQASARVTLQGAGLPAASPFFTVVSSVPGVSVNLAAFDGSYDFAGPSGFTSALLTSPTATGQYMVSAVNFASFIGNGTYTGQLSGSNTSVYSGPSQAMFSAGYTPSTSGTVRLTYTFTPFATPAVPEPASWIMAIVGFGFIGGSLRRRGMPRPKPA